MANLTSSMRNVGVNEESAERIAAKVKSRLVKAAVPITTEKIEESIVDELEKKNSKTAKKFKKRYKSRE